MGAPGDRTPSQRAGDAAEALVAARLTAQGWTVLARNVHVGRRELDIVAIEPGPMTTLVVVEVRWRANRSFGLPEETVDHRKRRRLHEAAFTLVDAGSLPRLPIRFDLVVVEPGDGDGTPRIRHHRAAL